MATTDMRMAPGSGPPPDLCEWHATAWDGYRTLALSYDPNDPKDWPGHHIMDSRTSHETRRKEWITKGREQLDMIEKHCRSGRSPQCATQPERISPDA